VGPVNFARATPILCDELEAQDADRAVAFTISPSLKALWLDRSVLLA
jgi:hypothetical protein